MRNISQALVLILVGVVGVFTFQLLSPKIQYSQPVTEVEAQTQVAENYPECQDHDLSKWHPVAIKDAQNQVVCVYGHEHGDAPPDWIKQNVGFSSMAGFHGNTSDQENKLKHPGMKGFEADIKGVKVYLRIHLASNVLDRSSRFHSYELFAKDASGNVSHFQGWLDSGDPLTDRIRYRDSSAGEEGKDPGRRPLVWAATKHACEVDLTWCIELWTLKTSAWGPDLIWGINDSTTFYFPGEKYSENIADWDLSGSLGVNRSMTFRIFRNLESLKKRGLDFAPTGTIWATQFGEIVTGPEDHKCHQEVEKFGKRYQNICLENYIAPTLPEVSGIEVTALKTFDSTGVKTPN